MTALSVETIRGPRPPLQYNPQDEHEDDEEEEKRNAPGDEHRTRFTRHFMNDFVGGPCRQPCPFVLVREVRGVEWRAA